MMIFPKLKQAPRDKITKTLDLVANILERYQSVVVFADFNLRLNTLWVSVRPVPGICLELPAVINHYVPEALLVNQRAPH